MIKNIDAWLGNPKRKYNQGLDIFNALASEAQKKNFKEFLEKGRDNVTEQFEMKFTLLVNQVAFIQNRVKSNPHAYKQAIATTVAGLEHIVDANKKVDSEIESNKTEGAVSGAELPEALQPTYNRIKEIVPLMARLHADMDNEPADDKRLLIIKELVKLDDERRTAWAKIDNYEPSELETQVAEKTIAMGADIQKRIGQLKENIARNIEGVKKHTANKKMNHAAKAQKRIEEYTDELTQLELIIGK